MSYCFFLSLETMDTHINTALITHITITIGSEMLKSSRLLNTTIKRIRYPSRENILLTFLFSSLPLSSEDKELSQREPLTHPM